MSEFCGRCRMETEWETGQALLQGYSAGVADFPGQGSSARGQTLSPDGTARLVTVHKCTLCGHSVIPPESGGAE